MWRVDPSYCCSVVDPSYSEEEGATQEDENTEQEQPGEGAEPGVNFSVIVLTFAFFKRRLISRLQPITQAFN